MTDFATLGMKIDSSQVKSGVEALDDLTDAGRRAEGSVENLGHGVSNAGSKIKGAGTAATQFAANAQAMARNSVGLGTAVNTMGRQTGIAAYQVQNLAFQANDMITSIASGNGVLRTFAQQSGQIAQIMQQSGLGVRAFGRELLELSGIIKVTRDAELAEAATNAAASAASIRAKAQQAAASIAAADTELALAQAAVRVAVTSEAATAAQAKLAAAHEAVAVAAAEAAIAEDALAVAEGRATRAAADLERTSVRSLGRVGAVGIGALSGIAIAGGLAVATFKVFQNQVRDSGTLEKYANSLGLTKKEMKELRQEVGGFSSKEMQDLDNRLRAFEVTWGDVFTGLAKTASDALDLSAAWQKFKTDAENAFIDVLNKGVHFAAVMKAFWTTDIGPGFWDNVKKNAAAAEKEIRKNVGTIRNNIIGAAEDRIKKAANAIIEDRPEKKGRKQSDHGLADALKQLDAQIKGQLALAAAYQVSDAAAIKAEALQKAEEQAIRHKGEVGIFYEKELALAVAKRAAEGGQIIGDLTAQTAAQKSVNDAVADGTLNAELASRQLQNEAQLRPLIAAAAVAEGKAKDELVKIIARLRNEQAKSNDETNRAQVLADTAKGQEQLDKLKLEATLIGATNKERATAIALLEAEQYLKAHPTSTAEGSPDFAEAKKHARDYVNTVVDIAEQAADLQTAQDNYNKSLAYTGELFGLINDQANVLGSTLSSAFGDFGNQIGGVITAITSLQEREQAIADWKRDEIKAAGGDAARLSQIEILAAKKSQTARAAATGQAISGLKSLFKEHSTGYKVMSAIEKGYAVLQAINTVKSIALDTTKTASSVANSAARASADGVAAVAKAIASLPFPLNLAAGAATAAALIAFGVKMFGGGGGGGGGTPPPSAEDLQEQAGTGSVLGDAKAKSDSIARSLEIVAANTNTDLQYTNEMLKALRSIDNSIAKMAGTVARQIQVSGSLFDTSNLKLGTTGSSGFLGLFGSKTTRTLFDLGLQFGAASVGSIINSGITGNSYQTIEKVKKKSGFLGIGGGTKTSYITTTGALDPDIAAAIQDVVTSLRDGLVAAANVIGIQGAEAMLNGFSVNLGKISFKDMTGEEIASQLNAIFSKVGDDMAKALFPALTQLQLVGEGLFETFIRVAKEYEAVDIALKSIGRTFGAVGVASIAARDDLVQLFGGLEDFIDATDFFRDNFLTEAEKIAPIAASVRAEMVRLGLASVDTREEFKAAVLGLDLTTKAGRDMYAALLAVAPAFDKVLDYFDQANKAQIDSLQSTVDQFTKFAESLRKYRDTLFQTDAAQGNAYNILRKRFLDTAALAATGNATALGGLENAGKSFLDAAKNNASTREQFLRDVALVARGVDQGIFAAEETADYAQLQLDALKNATSILQQISTNTQTTADALTQAPVSAPAGSTPNAQSFPTGDSGQLQQQNQQIIQQNQQIVALLSEQQRFWRRVDGEGLLIRSETDIPIYTQAAA